MFWIQELKQSFEYTFLGKHILLYHLTLLTVHEKTTASVSVLSEINKNPTLVCGAGPWSEGCMYESILSPYRSVCGQKSLLAHRACSDFTDCGKCWFPFITVISLQGRLRATDALLPSKAHTVRFLCQSYCEHISEIKSLISTQASPKRKRK